MLLAVLFLAMLVKGGPWFFEKGTLTAEDHDEIFKATKVNASIRARKQWDWKRGLTLSGPIDGMDQAKKMAEERILASVGRGGGGQESLRLRLRLTLVLGLRLELRLRLRLVLRLRA